MKIWSRGELQYLKSNFQRLKYKEIARKLDRTESSIWAKCSGLRLIKERGFCDNESIIRELRNCALKLGHSPTQVELPGILLSKCRRCLGGFNKAKKLAELKIKDKVHVLPQSAYRPSEKLAYIAGVLMGDGSFRFQTSDVRKSYVIILGSKDKDLMDYFIKTFQEWSNHNPTVSLIKDGYRKFPNGKVSYCQQVYVTQISFRDAWYLLKKFKDSPLFCLKFFPKKYWGWLLKGLWDAEGSVSLHGPNNLRTHFVNSDPRMLSLYKKVLDNFGFRYSIYSRDNNTKDVCVYNPIEAVKFIEKIKGVTINRKLTSEVIKTMHFLKHRERKHMDFQQKVYEFVKKIPMGKVETYAMVAQAIGHPRACGL